MSTSDRHTQQPKPETTAQSQSHQQSQNESPTLILPSILISPLSCLPALRPSPIRTQAYLYRIGELRTLVLTNTRKEVLTELERDTEKHRDAPFMAHTQCPAPSLVRAQVTQYFPFYRLEGGAIPILQVGKQPLAQSHRLVFSKAG